MNAGITSQYGFLYQRLIFIYTVLENISPNCLFVFEGKDDVDILPTEQIVAITKDQATCIQVKSGEVDKSCFSKIICNWLLLDKESELTYYLFLENELTFDDDISEQINNIYDYIVSGKSKKRSSISRKTYELFKSHIEDKDVDFVKHKIEGVLNSYEKNIFSLACLEENLIKTFNRDYCQDIVLYDIAAQKRLERFLQLINAEIDISIKSHSSYSLLYQEFFSLVSQVREEISDTRYKVDVSKLKKTFNSKAAQIVEENTSREVQQLYLVSPDTSFVVENIINELFYKDFREVYDNQREIDISNIEETAYENYRDSLFTLSDEEKDIPKKVFFETVGREIVSDLMPNSPIYRKGCYIYLTGGKIEKEKQITWGENDED